MRTFGVSDNSIENVTTWLVKKKLCQSQQVLVLEDFAFTKKPKNDFVFSLGTTNVLKSISHINSKCCRGKNLFIFASPIALGALNVVPLDYIKRPGYEFIYKSLDAVAYKLGADKPLVKGHDTHLDDLIDRIKSGSLLTPLMTFIYTLPNNTLQTPVKKAVVAYLYQGKSFKVLEKKLESLSASEAKIESIKCKLAEILLSDIGNGVRNFFKDVSKEKFETLCEKHSVSPYEIRYIKKIAETLVGGKRNAKCNH